MGDLIGIIVGNALSALAAAAIVWAGYGWIGVTRVDSPSPWLKTLVFGLVGLCTILAARLLYWGLIWEITQGTWLWTWPNVMFDTATVGFGLALLRARWQLIPLPERENWTWLTAPLFPPKRCIIPWRRIWRRRQ